MDKRSWLWRRKSSEKSPGETESSGSVSSISERYSDDQEAFRDSPVNASPNNAQSPDISSKIVGQEVHENVKSLTEKLSAALLSISAKEDLVKEHAKVAVEAVAGWEKSENEVAALKQQLQATTQKNFALDDALKECVRQLRQSREEQEKKFHEILIEKTNEWEFQKYELETHISELQNQLEALEKLNSTLKVDLLSAFDNLQIMKLEKELTTRSAEMASKQHLESIRKVAKLEAECRKLRDTAKRSSPFKDNNETMTNAICASITDGKSDEFKNDKVLIKNLTSSVDIDLMDDFLEMERLAASPEVKEDLSIAKENPSRDEFEKKFEKVTIEKQEVEMVLEETRNQLKVSHDQLILSEGKLVELQLQLNLANGSKRDIEIELETLESREIELESQLQAKKIEVKKLHAKIGLLEEKFEEEMSLSAKFAAKCQNIESIEAERRGLKSKLISAQLKGEQLQGKICTLEGKLKEQCTLTAEFTTKMEVSEEQRKELRFQLEDAYMEVKKQREKICTLEGKLKEQCTLSAEFTTKMEVSEEQRKELRFQLEDAHMEVKKLREKTGILENEVEMERALSSDLAAKCQSLKDELEAKDQEAELRQLVSSTLELKIRQERDRAVASGKLADCQKTITSLSKQLQSLAEFDLMLEVQHPELDDIADIRISHLLQERGLRPFSASSSLLPEFGKCFSPSRSCVHI